MIDGIVTLQLYTKISYFENVILHIETMSCPKPKSEDLVEYISFQNNHMLQCILETCKGRSICGKGCLFCFVILVTWFHLPSYLILESTKLYSNILYKI